MKILLLYLLLSYLSLTVQAVLFKGTKPDCVLVLVCLYSLRYGQGKGVTYGALSGLLVDTVSGFILGPHVIAKSVSGFIIGTLKEQLFQWNIFINTFVVAILSVINIFLVYLLLETFSRGTFASKPVDQSIMEIIYTTIFALILYPVFTPARDYRWELPA